MQKINAVNWISAARSCSPVASAAAYPSAMAQPRGTFADAHRQTTSGRN